MRSENNARLDECFMHTEILISYLRKAAEDQKDLDAMLFASMGTIFQSIHDKKRVIYVIAEMLKEDK